jgi:hypothetical protein
MIQNLSELVLQVFLQQAFAILVHYGLDVLQQRLNLVAFLIENSLEYRYQLRHPLQNVVVHGELHYLHPYAHKPVVHALGSEVLVILSFMTP